MALFDKDYPKVASELQGRVIRMGRRWYTVVEAVGYSRRQNSGRLYRPLLEMAPGTAYFPRHRNSLLFLIACKDGGSPGGCVLIREMLDQDNNVHSGPSAVSDALGVNEHGATGRLVEQANGDLALEIAHGEPKKNGGKSKNGGSKKSGLGPKAVSRLMPLITKRYLRDHKGSSFNSFLAELLARHTDEAELRKELSS